MGEMDVFLYTCMYVGLSVSLYICSWIHWINNNAIERASLSGGSRESLLVGSATNVTNGYLSIKLTISIKDFTGLPLVTSSVCIPMALMLFRHKFLLMPTEE